MEKNLDNRGTWDVIRGTFFHVSRITSHVPRLLIRLYQWCLSPWLGTRCRFEPSCSHYAQEAVEQHGALKGGFLAVRRLLRCHPFGSSGYDPVPPYNVPDLP